MHFETLYQELANGPQIIRALISGIAQSDAQVKPNAESWSILEVISHLYDEEREDFRQRLDIILHRPVEQWPAIDPVGWVTARRYNERNLAEMFENFVAERQKSLDWLKGLSSNNWDTTYITRRGPIKAGDMFAAWVSHDNLHTRQLVELRRARVVKITDPYDVGYAGDW